MSDPFGRLSTPQDVTWAADQLLAVNTLSDMLRQHIGMETATDVKLVCNGQVFQSETEMDRSAIDGALRIMLRGRINALAKRGIEVPEGTYP